MRARLKKGYAAIAIMTVAIVLLMVSMSAPVISTTTDFSIYNSGWNGTSGLAVLTFQAGKFVPTFQLQSTGTEITVAQVNLEDLNLDPGASALVIIGPTKGFTSSESKVVGDFVRNGGKLLLADDFGTGNSLLDGMGATSRFSNDLLMDLAYEKQPEFTVLFDFRPDPLTANVSTLLLNYPSSIAVGAGITEVVAYSSVASWLDTNGDRLQEWGEPRGPFPVVARERMGNGSIILLSDPSVLINGMSEYADDSQFRDNIVLDVCRDRTAVLFDESHRNFFDPVAVSMQFTGQISANTKAALIIVGMVLTLWLATDTVDRGAAWLIRNGRRALAHLFRLLPLDRFAKKVEAKPRPLTKDELVEKVTAEHPEWRPGLVRYLIRESQRHSDLAERKESR